jgi:hypothetical protein
MLLSGGISSTTVQASAAGRPKVRTTVSGWNTTARFVKPKGGIFANFRVKTGKSFQSRRFSLLVKAPGQQWETKYAGRTRANGKAHITLSVGREVGPWSFRVRVKRMGEAPGYSTAVRTLMASPTEDDHFVAVLASPRDQVASAADVQALRANIEVINEWFATQTIGAVQPRWQRDADGRPTIVQVPLPWDAEEIEDVHQWSVLDEVDKVDNIRAEFRRALPVIFLDAEMNIGADGINEYAAFVPGDHTDGTFFAEPLPEFGDYVTRSTARAMLRAFSWPHCGPHATAEGYVNDAAQDILADRSAPNIEGVSGYVLDYGRDDYYGTHVPGCTDITDDPLWETPAVPHPLAPRRSRIIVSSGATSRSLEWVLR